MTQVDTANFYLVLVQPIHKLKKKLLTTFNSLPHIFFRTAKLSACKEYSTLCVKLKGGKVITIGSPYQINNFISTLYLESLSVL